MSKVTPCAAGYNCPYCRQVDSLHLVQSVPKCPIEWDVYNETVKDRYTGKVMPFVARTMPVKRKEDESPLFPNGQVPRYERRHGNVKQVEQKTRV